MSLLPSSMPSTAELRTWLLDCATKLSRLERRLSPSAPSGASTTLSVRLALISEILASIESGAPLEPMEQQLLTRLLDRALLRLGAAIARMPDAQPPMPGA
jgi:hypothetical protein